MPGTWNETTILPRSVAQLSAFDRGKGCGECAEQERGGQPEGELDGRFAGAVGGGLASTMTSFSLFSASAWLMPVCEAIRRAR